MNNEEAKDLLTNLIGMVEDNQENDYDTALSMGIEALKNQSSVIEELESLKTDLQKLSDDAWDKHISTYNGLESAIDFIEDRIYELKGK